MNNMVEKAYLGIDVGSKGYLSLQYKGQWQFWSILELDIKSLNDVFVGIKEKYKDNVVCVIEDVHALFNSSAKATFNFGMNKGLLLALLESNQIAYHLVAPKTWQKEMWDNKDITYVFKIVISKNGEEKTRKKTNTKVTSFKAAKRMFPNIDFRRNSRCKNLDDNKVDATLMSEYARRKNL